MHSSLPSTISSPLSPAQRDLLLDYSRSPGSAPHVVASSIPLGRDVDVERWRRASEAVFRSEPGMQLRLVADVDHWRQELDPLAQLKTEVVHLDAAGPGLGAWVLERLAARPDVAVDGSFVQVLAREPAGVWHTAVMAPHIFVDGNAYRHFFEAVARVYETGEPPRPVSLGPLLAAIERAAAGIDQPDTLAFWRQRLAGVTPLTLTLDTRREGTGVDDSCLIPEEPSRAIDRFCEQRGVHPADFFLALYAIVLERFRERTGAWLIHTIRSSRGPDELDLMGCFYRALPTVIEPADVGLAASPGATAERLRSVRRELKGRMRISMLALQDMLPRGGMRAIFNFYNFAEVQALGAARELQTHFRHRPDELHLVVARRPQGFELRTRFNSATFPERRLLPRLTAVASQIAQGAETVGDCDWLMPDERPSPRPVRADRALTSVEQRVAAQAAASPDAVALTLDGAHVSYEELAAAANRLARRLMAAGIGPGARVGVFAGRSCEQVAASLAVLKAGGAFVPIDPDYPADRVQFFVADSDIAALVGGLPRVGLSPGCRHIPFTDLRRDCVDESPAPLAPRASIDDVAYVIYTSGSTGRPKGTLVTRRNLAALIDAAAEVYDFTPADTWTLLHSCAFDFSVWEIFGALAFGGRLVIVPSSVARSPADLARLIDEQRVTVLNQTPSAFYHLAGEPQFEATSLRYVIFGGEALEPRRLRDWWTRHGDQQPRLVNMYGITETTVHVTHRALTAADAEAGGSPIGVPLPGWHVYVADEDGRPVPHGCAGEIHVGGAGVAAGYFNRPELTPERFVPDPFTAGMVYRSGDLARQNSSGQLDYLGRADDQVKIRGYRIEPDEIAVVLEEHPAVGRAAVLAAPGPEGAVLVGYVVPRDGAAVAEGTLLEHLRQRLPAYMVCARVIAVDDFPRTAHGKLDRRALPMPGLPVADIKAFVAPRTASEGIVAALFAEATGAARVGAADDFFAIGGHSLAAMRIVARLRDGYGVGIGVSTVFERPTVAALAEYVDSHLGTASADRPRLVASADREALPVTYAQERVLLLQRLFPRTRAYTFEASLRFRGRLDTAGLSRALTRLVERHDAFRSTFHERDGRFVQRVHATCPTPFELIDLPPGADEATFVGERRHELDAQPFDPGSLPLVRWHLVRISDAEHLLLHREHHLIHDGWSFVVFIRELLECYRATLEGREPVLPPTLGVGDYAAAHRQWLEGPAGDEQRRYWQERLQGLPPRLQLPADRPRPPVFSFRGGQLRFDLPQPLVERLRSAARREGVTLYTLLLSAFSLVLSRLTESDDFAIAAGASNRRWEATEHMLGMLLNNVVFRLQPRADVLGRDYVRQVRDEVAAALAHQDLPFGEIVAAAGVERSPAETPLGTVFFSAYEGRLPDLHLPELDIDIEAGLPNGTAKFDWNVLFFARPADTGDRRDLVTVLWEYASDLFDRGSIVRAQRQFLVAIESLLDGLDRPLSELTISDEREQQFLMEAAEGPHVPYPRDAGVTELFDRVAAAHPDAVALRCEATTWTYADLARRSARIATRLTTAGVADEEPVGLLFGRGPDAVAGMLGILRAGAAYLPLSPNDPPARLARLIDTAGVRRVLTTETLRPRLDDADVTAVTVESMHEDDAASVVAPVSGGTRLAAVLFTSGSTGEPKGVEVLHRGIVRLVCGADYASFEPDERLLQLAPLSFDASTFEIWGALLNGGELVILPQDLPSPTALGDAIARHGITTMWLNAALFNAIVDELPDALAPLRQLLVGGEALSVPHVQRAQARLPHTRLINGYGPTENTTFSCCYEVPRPFDETAPVPIGRPIANSRARVLDSDGRLAPAGAVGEICVGGDGLARGYRNRADLTAAAFVRDPFDPYPAARLYRTGDLGRVREDGVLEFHGRRDSQVKIRGHRVEPAEVEAALCAIDGVATASVLPVAHPAAGPTLAAFVVPEKGVALRPAAIIESISRRLPAYLVPARVIVRPSLPVTAHGKLDTALLGREAQRAMEAQEIWPSLMPRTALEGITCGVFAEVLGRDRFEADQDFFAAGGHSLLVLRAISRLERMLGVKLEPGLFLHGATPRRLAEAIERRSGDAGAVTPGAGRSIVRVTPGEHPLFFAPGGEGGDVSLAVYARLALHLPGVAFHGLRLADGSEEDAPTVEALAAAVVSEILTAEPTRPIHLVGGCIGGIIAYEMARQLHDAGRPPRSLVLLDATYPSFSRRARHRSRGWSSRVRHHALDWLQGSGLSLARQDEVYRALSRLLPFAEHEASPRVPTSWIRFVAAILRYRPRRLPQRVTLLATDDLVRTGSVAGWQRLLGEHLSVRTLEGTHWSYIRTHVAETASVLRASLQI